MKRIFILFPVLMFAFYAAAQDSYTTDLLISQIDYVDKPYVKDDYVIFTAEDSARHVGIAFDFENFTKIHSFERLKKINQDDEVVSTLYFYILQIPKGVTEISYRLVIDGLWTADPLNPEKVYNQEAGTMLSKIYIPKQEKPATSVIGKNLVRFVYQGEPGLMIRLGGSFTNWDSSIYMLNEIRSGLYQLEITLPSGIHYYSFYEGITPFTDPSNPEQAYTLDGKTASVVMVE